VAAELSNTNNGVLTENIAANLRSSNYIGKSNWAVDPLFKGSIADARVYDSARTAAQIQADMAGVPDTTNLVMAYSLNGNANSSVTNGQAATLSGSPTYSSFRGLSLSSDTGSANDLITNTATQTIRAALTASLSAGDILEGSVDGGTNWTNITSMVSGAAITWTGAQLSSGSNNIVFRVTDLAGNVGAKIGTNSYVLDTVAPTTTASITSIVDNKGLLQGVVANGGTTDDTYLVDIRGTLGGATEGASLTSGETLRIYDGVEYLGNATVTVVAGGQSTWTYIDDRLLVTLNGKALSYTARVADAALNEGTASNAYTATIDTVAPTTTASITSITDNVGSLQGIVTSGGATDDTSLVIGGTLGGATAAASLASGETLRIYDGATYLGNATVTVASSGQSTWTFTDPRTLSHAQAIS
jgi:hypothetical protein